MPLIYIVTTMADFQLYNDLILHVVDPHIKYDVNPSFTGALLHHGHRTGSGRKRTNAIYCAEYSTYVEGDKNGIAHYTMMSL